MGRKKSETAKEARVFISLSNALGKRLDAYMAKKGANSRTEAINLLLIEAEAKI